MWILRAGKVRFSSMYNILLIGIYILEERRLFCARVLSIICGSGSDASGVEISALSDDLPGGSFLGHFVPDFGSLCSGQT